MLLPRIAYLLFGRRATKGSGVEGGPAEMRVKSERVSEFPIVTRFLMKVLRFFQGRFRGGSCRRGYRAPCVVKGEGKTLDFYIVSWFR